MCDLLTAVISNKKDDHIFRIIVDSDNSFQVVDFFNGGCEIINIDYMETTEENINRAIVDLESR